MEPRFGATPGDDRAVLGTAPADSGSVSSPSTTDLGREARQAAAGVVDQAQEQVKTQLARGKERATSSLESVADALRTTGQNLRDGDQATIGGYAEQLAEKLSRVSGYLQNREIEQLTREVEDTARRQPALFLGGAFVAGLLIARFFKSSQEPSLATSSYPMTYSGAYDQSMSPSTYGGPYDRGASSMTSGMSASRSAYASEGGSRDVT
jgi:hypothetical protein